MKTKLLIIIFLSFFLISFSQTETFVIKAVDAKGQTDSVVIGYRENATIGIDESLNEVDYYGKPYSEIDIRSIQRNTSKQNSLWLDGCGLNPVEPFQQNIDIKNDFRQYLSCGNHFIIQVHAKNYPITLQIENLHFQQDVPYNSYLNNGDCGTISGELKYFSVQTFKDSTENQLIGFHPQIIDACNTGIKKLKSISQLLVYPNPAKDVLMIKSAITERQLVVIYNGMGNEIARLYTKDIENKLDISNYQKGIYLVRMGSVVSKFTKQ